MSILTRRNFLGSVAAAGGLAYTAGTGHGAFAYRQSDPRCDTKRGAVDNSNMINLCARIIVG
jgi:hypothetical protein